MFVIIKPCLVITITNVLCMCVCIHIINLLFIHVQHTKYIQYIHTCTWIQTYIHTILHVHIHSYLQYIHTYIHTHIHTYIHTYTHIHTYILVFIINIRYCKYLCSSFQCNYHKYVGDTCESKNMCLYTSVITIQ